MKMKCISLWQPHASLIGRGKIYETRHWSTNYRGPLAIHAAKSKTDRDLFFTNPFRHTLEEFETFSCLPFGAIVATCDLTDCVPTGKWALDLPYPSAAFGNFSLGRYAWKLENVRILPEPIPMRGQQGFWEVDIDA